MPIYCGQLGKQDNCQVAVSLSLANHAASLPVSYRLYLPRDWAEDPARRAKAGVPEEIAFRTKPEIALDLLRAAAQAGLPRGVAVMDAAYGKDTDFRTGVRRRTGTSESGFEGDRGQGGDGRLGPHHRSTRST